LEVVDFGRYIHHGDVLVADYCSCIDTLLGDEAYGSSVQVRNLAMQSVFAEGEMVLTLEIRGWNIVRRRNAVFHLGYCEWRELLLLQPPLPQQFQYGGFGAGSRWYGG
jgi:hypothetical protein